MLTKVVYIYIYITYKKALLITFLNESELFFPVKYFQVLLYKLKLLTKVEGDPKAPFLIATTQGVGEDATPFPGLIHFTLDPYLIMLTVKQGGIKYLLYSLWYDSAWDWTQVFRAIAEHSNRLANVRLILTGHCYITVIIEDQSFVCTHFVHFDL